MSSAVQQTLHAWLSVLPGGNGEQHASMSNQEGHHKKKSTNKKSQTVKYNNTKGNNGLEFDKNTATKIVNNHQRTMSSFTKNNKNAFPTIFGDTMIGKENGVCRIVSQNIGCLGVQYFANNKIRTAKEWLFNNHVDVCGWQEIGLANHKFQRHERLNERMRDPRRRAMRISTGTNIHDDIGKFQWGGTAIMSFDLMANMTKSTGVDDSGLGRWSWMLLEGHRQKYVRIVSAYNPCRTQTNQVYTVYSQHKRYFLNQQKDVCPRLQFRKDLCAFLTQCIEKNEQIVLLIDCNENLAKLQELQRHLTSAPLFLTDPIREKYYNGGALPPTQENGSYPIDGIFVTDGLVDIVKGGWLKFGDGIGDHRPLFIDISIKRLLGKYKNSTQPYCIRRLQCQNKKSVMKYNELLEKQYLHHNTLAKLDQFHALKSDPVTQEDLERLYKIDKVRTQAVRFAEKHCRKLYMGGKPWTPELNQLGRAINAWHLIIKKKSGKPISSRHIQRMSKGCNIPSTRHLSIESCKILRAQAFQNYNQYAAEADTHRYGFQSKLILDAESEGDFKKAKQIRQHQLNEELRQTHKNVKMVVNNNLGAPYHMELTTANGVHISTDKEAIENALRTEYENKYRLAYSSPFLQEPLLSELGQFAINDKAKAILNGTYECDLNIPKHTKTFIRHLKKDKCLRSRPLNPVDITTEQSNAFWRNIKEKISSSPSLMHIGTYKAALSNRINAEIQAQMISIPYAIGHPLPRTTHCVNVSLQKKGKGIAPGDLRTIWLLEADLNAGSRIHFVKRMMNDSALNNDLLPQSQYSKKGSKASEAAIVKVLFFDILRQTRKPGVFLASDLHQCFDRMAHPVCSLVSQRLGVHENVVKCMITAIQQMKHTVRTGYGDANVFYGNYEDKPLQGGGQGNGASLPLFVAISCILISILESAVKGVYLRTAMSLTLIHFIAIMYVDDTDILLAALDDTETIYEVIMRAKKAATVWQKAVLDSGGAVRPDKCYWSAIDFAWTSGKWRYKKMTEIAGYIRIRNPDGKLETIKRYDLDSANEGLGVYLTPHGSLNLQLTETSKKIIEWTTKVVKSSLTHKETYVAATTTIFRTIMFILPTCSFSRKQCRVIEVLLYKNLLPKMGVSSKMPLPYRFAPYQFQGMNLMQVFVHIMIEKLKVFLFHADQPTQLGQTLKASLEAIQIEVGSKEQFFSLSYEKYGFLTPFSWLATLWDALYSYGISLKPGTWNLKLPRTNDLALMDAVVDSNLFNRQEIEKINHCRLYLQVFFLSDIVSGNGQYIIPELVRGERFHQWNSKWQWPRQPRPPKSSWSLWDIAITEVWAKSESTQLQIPLGNWIHSTHMRYQYKIDHNKRILYENNQGMKRKYEYDENRSSRLGLAFTKARLSTTSVSALIPTIVRHNDQHLICEKDIDQISKITTGINRTWNEYFDNLDNNTKTLLQFSSIPDNGIHLVNAIKSKEAIGVTDCSVKINSKTSAISWIITDANRSFVCEGRAGCPTFYAALDSYSGEMFGIYVMLTAVKVISQFHNVKKGHFVIACDNDSSLSISLDSYTRAKPTDAYYDLIWAIQELRKDVNFTVKAKNVAGHQEKKKKKLNIYEKLNVEMDKKAKEFRHLLEKGKVQHIPNIVSRTNWKVKLGNLYICYNMEQSLRDHVQGTELINHMIRKQILTRPAVKHIDWDAIKGSAKLLPAGDKLWISKFVSGFCGTAAQMYVRDRKKKSETQEQYDLDHSKWKSDQCPICKCERENTAHVMQCMHKKAYNNRIRQIKDLQLWFDLQHTDPLISSCIVYTLESKVNVSFHDTMCALTDDDDYIQCALSQDMIGKVNLHFGRITKRWRQLQREYLLREYPKTKFSADAWAKRFVCKLYKMAQNVWKYRCDKVHGSDQKKISRREKRALKKEIKAQYALGKDGVRANEKDLLDVSMNKVLKYTVSGQQYWLKTVKASRTYTTEQNKNMFTGMRNILRRWAFVPD